MQDAPKPPENGSVENLLSQEEAQLLGRTWDARYRLEMFEFAYEAAIRSLHWMRVVNQFASFFVAVGFLYLRYLFNEDSDLHQWVGNIGTSLSLLVMALTVWGAFDRWTDQIVKKRHLSERIREFIVQQHKFADVRPVDKKKIAKWPADVEEFENERKNELATVRPWFLVAGYQHVANKYPARGIRCTKCSREWTPDMNKTKWRNRRVAKTFTW